MRKARIIAIVLLVLMLPVMLSGCAAKGAGAANPGAKDDALECNWFLKVDQTIPIKDGDVTINHTLVLIARKEGGKDVYGTYEGAAYIGSHLDISNLSKILVQLAGGFDVDIFANNLSFEIEPFDKQRYSAYGSKDDASLAPLVEYESMALLSPEMKGGVIINPTVKSSDGLQGGYSESGGGTAPVAIKIAIRSGKVHVDIPSIVNRSFEGMITGDPQTSNEEYRQLMKKIEELADRQDKETTEGAVVETGIGDDGGGVTVKTGGSIVWDSEKMGGMPQPEGVTIFMEMDMSEILGKEFAYSYSVTGLTKEGYEAYIKLVSDTFTKVMENNPGETEGSFMASTEDNERQISVKFIKDNLSMIQYFE